MYSIAQIATIFPDGTHVLPEPDAPVRHVCIDSRKAAWQPHAIFIALQGARADGHRYIKDAWDHGVRNFLVQENIDLAQLPEGNYIRVPNVLEAFHKLAAYHRSQYDGKVVAIIGSNGKTWVKEWLYMLMYRDMSVYRSPGSYNSQVGVPLSVWNIPLDT
ncbi:MAG TPA: Mur ligase domain-containing protein, partial [Saprospiraceae bacterium]